VHAAEDDEDDDGDRRAGGEEDADLSEGAPQQHLSGIGRHEREIKSEMDELRAALLALHKAVLAVERRQYERIHGQVGNAEFLQIVSDPVRYGWLKPFSSLILAFDDEEQAADPADEARALLMPPKPETPFGRRYLSLMQRDPTIVVEHRNVTRLL
jgi:hypothetical protein